MYSLDYLLNRLDHNVLLRLSTPQIISHMYSLYYLLHRSITNVQFRISALQIPSPMYSLDYLLHRFDHTCTAWITYLTDLITMYCWDYPLRRLYHTCTAYIIYYTDGIPYVQLRLSTPQIWSHIYSLGVCLICLGDVLQQTKLLGFESMGNIWFSIWLIKFI